METGNTKSFFVNGAFFSQRLLPTLFAPKQVLLSILRCEYRYIHSIPQGCTIQTSYNLVLEGWSGSYSAFSTGILEMREQLRLSDTTPMAYAGMESENPKNLSVSVHGFFSPWFLTTLFVHNEVLLQILCYKYWDIRIILQHCTTKLSRN